MGRNAMPNDLTIQAVDPVLGARENPAQPKPETVAPPAQAPPTPPAAMVANPTLRFDAAAGLVVLEYHDAAGKITTTIPTLRQLEAYRQWHLPIPGQPAAPSDTAPGSAPRKA